MDEYFRNLYKHKGKGFGSMTETSKKAEDLNKLRRQTRNNMMLQRRKITEDKILTPAPKTPKKQVLDIVPNKRFAMLKKWKEEKERKKEAEKNKAKPLFKVCRVSVPLGLPKLETVNTQIKGKPFKASQFAPTDYKFTAPSNIKPIDIPTLKNTNPKSKQAKTGRSNNNLKQKNTAVNKNIEYNSGTGTSGQYNNSSNKGNKFARTPIVVLNNVSDKHSAHNTKPKGKTTPHISTPHRGNLRNGYALNIKSQGAEGEVTSSKAVKDHPVEGNTKRKLRSQKKVSIVDLTDSPVVSNPKQRIRKTPFKSKTLATNNIEIEVQHQSLYTDKNSDHPLNETFEILEIDDDKTLPISGDRSSVPESNMRKRNNKKIDSINLNNIDKCSSKDVQQKNTSRRIPVRTPKSDAKATPQSTPRQLLPSSMPKLTPQSTKKSRLPLMTNEHNDKTPRRSRRLARKEVNEERIPQQKLMKDSHNEDTNVPTVDDINTGRKDKRINGLERQKAIDLPEYVPSNSSIQLDRSCSPDYPIRDNCDSDTSSKLVPKSFSTPDMKKTPDNSDRDCSPVYISPFVTISRGKDSARKEYQSRLSQGGSLPESTDIKRATPSHTSPKAGAAYFTRLVDNEIIRIKEMCDEWENYKDTETPCESACDMINTAIGQSNLLITKKFKQFKGLIEACEASNGERTVTCTDLHGFWEVVYMQVIDLRKRFAYLETLKNNNWEEIMEEKKKPVPKRRGRPTKKTAPAATSSLKDAIRAARNKKKNQTNNLLAVPNTSEEVVFNGGFFVVRSPTHLSPSSVGKTPRRSARKSLLATVLTQEANRSSNIKSPGLTMMKASHAAKLVENSTPAKSILKTDNSRSAVRLNKSVLFSNSIQVEGEEKIFNSENDLNSTNLIHFTPDQFGSASSKRTSQRIRLTRSKLF